MTRLAKRWRAFSAELAWIVASDPAWPVLKESSSVRASIPRTSPRMIRSGRQRRADFKRSSKEMLRLESIGLAFDGQDVRLLDAKLRRILDHHDALSSGIACARMFRSVVFPVPVPPLIRSVLPLRI